MNRCQERLQRTFTLRYPDRPHLLRHKSRKWLCPELRTQMDSPLRPNRHRLPRPRLRTGRPGDPVLLLIGQEFPKVHRRPAPAVASQTRTVLSSDRDTMVRRSGANSWRKVYRTGSPGRLSGAADFSLTSFSSTFPSLQITWWAPRTPPCP